MKKCPTQPILVRNCVVAFLEQEIYMNCFQWRILWGDFGRQPSSSEAHNRGCFGGNWGRGAGFLRLHCAAAWQMRSFCQWWRPRQPELCQARVLARNIFSGQVGAVAASLWRHGAALGELFYSAAFHHQKKNRRGRARSANPPGTKTITKTKRREIWMTHWMSLWIFIDYRFLMTN